MKKPGGLLLGHCVNLKERSPGGTLCFLFLCSLLRGSKGSAAFFQSQHCSLDFTQNRNDNFSLRGKAGGCFWLLLSRSFIITRQLLAMVFSFTFTSRQTRLVFLHCTQAPQLHIPLPQASSSAADIVWGTELKKQLLCE